MDRADGPRSTRGGCEGWLVANELWGRFRRALGLAGSGPRSVRCRNALTNQSFISPKLQSARHARARALPQEADRPPRAGDRTRSPTRRRDRAVREDAHPRPARCARHELRDARLGRGRVLTPFRSRLPDGPLDLIGDVHGEIDALRTLLDRLGVDVARSRAERPLVFVGDLVDRGPDSVAVVELYAKLAAAGLAFAVLGNHELNVLMDAKKTGNGWFFGEQDTFKLGSATHPFPSRLATPVEQASVRATLAELPLVLERSDLRVVHAMWDAEAAERLPPQGDWAALAAQIEREIEAILEANGTSLSAKAEAKPYANLRDPGIHPQRSCPPAPRWMKRVSVTTRSSCSQAAPNANWTGHCRSTPAAAGASSIACNGGQRWASIDPRSSGTTGASARSSTVVTAEKPAPSHGIMQALSPGKRMCSAWITAQVAATRSASRVPNRSQTAHRSTGALPRCAGRRGRSSSTMVSR